MLRNLAARSLLSASLVLSASLLACGPAAAQASASATELQELARFVRTLDGERQICEQRQSGFTAARGSIDDRHRALQEAIAQERSAAADAQKALQEADDALRASNQADAEYDRLYLKCSLEERRRRVEWTQIPECVEADNFFWNVAVPRRETYAPRVKDLAYQEDRRDAYRRRQEEVRSEYFEELRRWLASDLFDLLAKQIRGEPTPDAFSGALKRHCSQLDAGRDAAIGKAGEVANRLIRDCRFADAGSFIAALPEWDDNRWRQAGQPLRGKAGLEQLLADARQRESQAASRYEKSRAAYRQGQIDERAGNFARAGSLYRSALADLREGRSLTRCPGKPELFDDATAKLEVAMARLAHQATTPPPASKAQAGQCAVPSDLVARKSGLKDRIKHGNTFRKDGGGGWHPDVVMRAGYSVGAEQMPATVLELNAMSRLIDGYEGCYARYWAAVEGELAQLVKARDAAAQRRDSASAQRISAELLRRNQEVAATRDQCIRQQDDNFKKAIAQARSSCKPGGR